MKRWITGEHDQVVRRTAPKLNQMNHISKSERRVTREYNAWTLEFGIESVCTNTGKVFKSSASNEWRVRERFFWQIDTRLLSSGQPFGQDVRVCQRVIGNRRDEINRNRDVTALLQMNGQTFQQIVNDSRRVTWNQHIASHLKRFA